MIIENMIEYIFRNKEWIFSGIGLAAASSIIFIIKNALHASASGGEFSGKWRVQMADQPEGTRNGMMWLHHVGPWVWGKCELYGSVQDGKTVIRLFKYSGRFQREQAVMHFYECTKDKRMVGVTALHMGGRGKIVHGCNAFWHHDGNAMKSVNFFLHPIEK